jgi:hypothetical protein
MDIIFFRAKKNVIFFVKKKTLFSYFLVHLGYLNAKDQLWSLINMNAKSINEYTVVAKSSETNLT